MDTLTIIALFNMVLWGGAFAVLWWMARAETALAETIDALERRLEDQVQ